jgi:hypothetical protein
MGRGVYAGQVSASSRCPEDSEMAYETFSFVTICFKEITAHGK